MKCQILSQIDIKDEWLEELQQYVDWDITIKRTDSFLQTKWNPWFRSTWGDFDWIRKVIPTGDIKCYVTSKDGLTNVGITQHLGMYDMVDSDKNHDFYIGVSSRLDRRAKANGFKYNFTWLVIHEFLHGNEKQKGGPDRTHDMESQGRLVELLDEPEVVKRSFLEKLQVKLIGLLTKYVIELKSRLPMLPVPFVKITQAYGVYRPVLYPATGYHWGLDLRASQGTPIVMPVDGKVIEVGKSKALGHWMQIAGDDRFFFIPHLQSAAVKGVYNQGDTIANVGTTGLVTAVHFHIEIWNEQMVNRVTQLKDRGFKITEDPAVYFKLIK